MTGRRVVVSGVGAALLALVLSACGTSPSLPPAVVVSSPYYGSSTTVVDSLSGIAHEGARVRVCSLTGGPLAVDVHSAGADTNTTLTVRVLSTDWETTGDTVGATLIEESYDRPTVADDRHFESSRPLRPGECADVGLSSARNLFAAGAPFSITVTW